MWVKGSETILVLKYCWATAEPAFKMCIWNGIFHNDSYSTDGSESILMLRYYWGTSESVQAVLSIRPLNLTENFWSFSFIVVDIQHRVLSIFTIIKDTSDNILWKILFSHIICLFYSPIHIVVMIIHTIYNRLTVMVYNKRSILE